MRPVDVNHSGWDNRLERRDDGAFALRLGFRQIDAFREAWGREIADHAPMTRSRRSPSAPGCPAARSICWPRPTPIARWGVGGVRGSGRRGG
ncbi:hypothetical protein P0F65_15945 [Sphingomonas sp. I4]